MSICVADVIASAAVTEELNFGLHLSTVLSVRNERAALCDDADDAIDDIDDDDDNTGCEGGGFGTMIVEQRWRRRRRFWELQCSQGLCFRRRRCGQIVVETGNECKLCSCCFDCDNLSNAAAV